MTYNLSQKASSYRLKWFFWRPNGRSSKYNILIPDNRIGRTTGCEKCFFITNQENQMIANPEGDYHRFIPGKNIEAFLSCFLLWERY